MTEPSRPSPMIITHVTSHPSPFADFPNKTETYFHFYGYSPDTENLLVDLADPESDLDYYMLSQDVITRGYIDLLNAIDTGGKGLVHSFELPRHLETTAGYIHLCSYDNDSCKIFAEQFANSIKNASTHIRSVALNQISYVENFVVPDTHRETYTALFEYKDLFTPENVRGPDGSLFNGTFDPFVVCSYVVVGFDRNMKTLYLTGSFALLINNCNLHSTGYSLILIEQPIFTKNYSANEVVANRINKFARQLVRGGNKIVDSVNQLSNVSQ